MKRFALSLLIFFTALSSASALEADTSNWLNNTDSAEVSAFELDLKSDLKNDFRLYQVTLTNKTDKTIDADVVSNKRSIVNVKNLIKESLTFKELMYVPKQLATESYKEDVGTGNVAKAHKSLIYVSSTAGAVVTGAGFLGLYPQQKVEEYFSHKKIKKEYKKITSNLIDEFTVAPYEQKDFVMLVPLEEMTPYIKLHPRNEDSGVYNEYHQL